MIERLGIFWSLHQVLLFFESLQITDDGPDNYLFAEVKVRKTSDFIWLLLALQVRVSQKTQKSEFWNVTYPSGFHRLDEPPEKISAL